MFIFLKFPLFYCHLECHHLRLSLKRILVACHAPVVGHGTCWHHPPHAPHCGGAWIDRTWTHLQIVLKNALNWTKLKSQHITNLMDSVCSFFDKALISIHSFICLACSWMSWEFGVSNRGHTAFELIKPLKNLCSTHFLLSKPACNILKSL